MTGRSDKLLSRPIAFQRVYATIAGCACGGLFLSQAKYWSERKEHEGGWFYKTYAEWERETALNRTELDKIRHHLVKMEILETKLEGVPKKLYYRINDQKLDEYLDSVLNENFTQKRPKAANPRKMRSSGVVDRQQEGVVDRQQTNIYTENTNRDYRTETTAHTRARANTTTAFPESWERAASLNKLDSDNTGQVSITGFLLSENQEFDPEPEIIQAEIVPAHDNDSQSRYSSTVLKMVKT